MNPETSAYIQRSLRDATSAEVADWLRRVDLEIQFARAFTGVLPAEQTAGWNVVIDRAAALLDNLDIALGLSGLKAAVLAAEQEMADIAHAPFKDENSDFISYLKLWKWYHEKVAHLSTSKLRRTCQENFLSYVRLREWHDTHRQLHALVTEMGVAQRNGMTA